MKSELFAAMCGFLVGCSGADQSELLEPCDPPASAEYELTGASDECGAIRMPTLFNGGQLSSILGDDDPELELLQGACVSRTTARRMSLVVTFDRDWTAGSGQYVAQGCMFDVQLRRTK